MNSLWLFLSSVPGPAEKLKTALSTEIGAVFFMMVIFTSVVLFWKRAFTAFIGFALFGMLVSVFVFEPQYIKTMGENGFRWLFEAYIK